MDHTHELADLISEFLSVALEAEARERITAEAEAIDATYEQFLAMSLTHLITSQFQVIPSEEVNDNEAANDELDS